MATALMAWLSAPAPTTWTSTAPAWRTAPAIAPATEFGLDFVETLSVSIGAPRGHGRRGNAASSFIRRRTVAFLPRLLPTRPFCEERQASRQLVSPAACR